MRNRERIMLADVSEKLQEATDLVATILEGREGEEEGGVNFDLRMLYGGLVGMVDDVEEISYEL
jgi:hypothetical protein